ncbi:MAG: formimidoylglutamate deiminase [Gammaproteobacteria bacterium]
MITLNFQSALLPEGFAHDVAIEVDVNGNISRVTANANAGGSGCALPGIANLHSHAHQRAMAGHAERSGDTRDSFWTWRQTMYGFLDTMNPEQLHAVASQLYVEMLKAGFTRVAEFQYLHHQPDGKPYAERAEMSLQTLHAATETGLGITLLPVHYQFGGFGRQPVGEQQKRFYNTADDFVTLLDTVHTHTTERPDANTGVALHSLRAVDAEAYSEVASNYDALTSMPVHIHIAEQLKEVEDCKTWCGARPVEHLLSQFPVDHRWCLIHATHMSQTETSAVARSGAVAGLCPTTEANLGDGVFNAVEYTRLGGAYGIGSDSHISVSPVEELRWLEYTQRLARHGRNELAGRPDQSTGRTLLEQSASGGAQACGHNAGELAVGKRADMIVLDTNHPILCEREDDTLIDSWIFSGNQNTVSDVYVGGQKVIDNGRHPHEEAIAKRFKSTLQSLRSTL